MHSLILTLILCLLCTIEVTAQGVGGIAVGGGVRGRANNYVPDPPPDGCVGFDYTDTDYTGARAQSGSAGETLCISDAQFAGGFDFSASDPGGNGDDSTLVIAASGGGYWVRDFAHTVGDPIELGWYEGYTQNRDIYTWFTNMASYKGAGGSLYMHATTVAGVDTVLQGTAIDWAGTYGIKTFEFLEDADSLTLFMKQGGQPTGDNGSVAWWKFVDYNSIRVGGPNLYLTFKGEHPGLGIGSIPRGGTTNCVVGGASSGCLSIEETPGMIDVDLNDGWTTATLLEWQANIHDSRRSGLNITGRQLVNGGVAGRVAQANMAGEMWNGGVRVNGGVRNIHWDPDKSSSRDPYNTSHGWGGDVATGTTVNGSDSLACPMVWNYKEGRQRGGAGGAFFADKVTGGTEVQYGSASVSHFATDQIGNGPNDPFIIKYHDTGATGPTNRTGREHGYLAKTTVLQTIYKTDPLPIYTGDGKERRHVKFVQLENTHNNGIGFINSDVTGAGCTYGAGNNGYSRFWLPEASRDGVSSQYVTFNVNAVFERPGGSQVVNDNWIGLGSGFGSAQMQGSGADCTPGSTACDRTYGHHMIIMSPYEFAADIGMMDADTLSGTGIVNSVSLVDPGSLTDGAGTDYCRDNVIGIAATGNLTVNDDITIDNDCDGTIIDSITMPSTASIVASATFTCLGEGVLAAQTWDLNNASHRTTLGATGSDPYTICTP